MERRNQEILRKEEEIRTREAMITRLMVQATGITEE